MKPYEQETYEKPMKNITGIILLSVFLTLNLSEVKAQKKCKFDYEKTDEFTGKIIKGNTTPIDKVTPFSQSSWYLGINREGDEFYISIYIQLSGELNTYLEKGDSLMFKFDDGEIITVYANKRSSPETNAGVVGNRLVVVTSYRTNYNITTEEMEKFTKSFVDYIRMNVYDKVIEKKLIEKYRKKLINNALCIMK